MMLKLNYLPANTTIADDSSEFDSDSDEQQQHYYEEEEDVLPQMVEDIKSIKDQLQDLHDEMSLSLKQIAVRLTYQKKEETKPAATKEVVSEKQKEKKPRKPREKKQDKQEKEDKKSEKKKEKVAKTITKEKPAAKKRKKDDTKQQPMPSG